MMFAEGQARLASMGASAYAIAAAKIDHAGSRPGGRSSATAA